MLVFPRSKRQQRRRDCVGQLASGELVVQLRCDGFGTQVRSVSWRDYWARAMPFLGCDARLMQRLNRLKAACSNVRRRPKNQDARRMYCWRYFGLLHHALRIARDEPERGQPWAALRRLVGFETFTIESCDGAMAAGLITSRNPVYLLGRLPSDSAPPTPRHVPLAWPAGAPGPYYHYRQILLDSATNMRMALMPALSPDRRLSSFGAIDCVTRALRPKPDPYWRPRSRVLAERVLVPLLSAMNSRRPGRKQPGRMALLDLGAGTGHVVARAWRWLCELDPAVRSTHIGMHFVDACEPSADRSCGLVRAPRDFAYVDWTAGDYRELLDRDGWCRRHNDVDIALLCKVLGNASTFCIEPMGASDSGRETPDTRCLPHRGLAPRRQPSGMRLLSARPVPQPARGGTLLPQFSLSDYFAAIKSMLDESLVELDEGSWYLPVRRFNPLSLTTRLGRSVLAQLMRIASAVVIEDVDLRPEHLRAHRDLFGLGGTAAVHLVGDAFNTQAEYYIVTKPAIAARLHGDRLW